MTSGAIPRIPAASLVTSVAGPYDFAQSVKDHGWVALAPFHWNAPRAELERVERLASGRVVLLRLSAAAAAGEAGVQIAIEGDCALTAEDGAEIVDGVRWMLRLDEDFTQFYELCVARSGLDGKMGVGRGRLLRSPTLFEDVAKTICTTNITWPQTKTMVERLVQTLGDPLPRDPSRRAFPTPEQVARAGEDVLRQTVRMGYRGPYLLNLAQDMIAGRIDLEGLKTAGLTVAELRRELKRIKGVGDYAVATLLMLLGHYEELAIDSALRSYVARTYFDGRIVTDREIAELFAPWGQWQYLASWFDFASSWQTPLV